MPKRLKVIITCEHATNLIALKYQKMIPKKELHSHRGIDFGAKEYAQKLAKHFKTQPHFAETSRLVVDLNSSITNRRKLFSEYMKPLRPEEKRALLECFYLPYRNRIEAEITKAVAAGFFVLHLSAHSFTPVMRGKIRACDVGLLFDPRRAEERKLAEAWRTSFNSRSHAFRLRFNYPYKGADDGLTRYFRNKFKASSYAGFEIEMNQKYPLTKSKEWPALQRLLIDSLADLL